MTDIFVFGTLRHAPVLRVVAGYTVATQSAHLPEASVMRAKATGWPVLGVARGQVADGLIFAADDAALARLDAYEACFGYARDQVVVQTVDGPRPAAVYRPVTGESTAAPETVGPWSLDAWQRAWGELEILTAQEVMDQLQSATPAEIGARFGVIASRAQAVVSARRWQRPGLVGTNPPRGDVTVLRHTRPYSKFFTVAEVALRHRQFDGQWSALQERAIFRVTDAVTVLPYDPVRDRILLIEQLRIGAFVQEDPHPWLLEPIAGMIDAGETPEATAHREAQEEAGLILGALHHVARYYPSPGGIAQVLHSYVALADLPDDITGRGGHLAEGEDILSHIVPWDLACTMLEAGDMANAPLVISMQWLMLNRTRLRASG
ncbi:NUDIX domain-containing protein [Rhodobacterales bacterium LSUCC0031]|nr:NUDIX domain-containing protein [Rhodobacterales bacterium LSUCC0031]